MTAKKKNSRHQGSKGNKESNSTIPMKKSSSKNPKPRSRNAILQGFSNLLRKAFSGHKSDLLGLALFVLGLLSTLGLYFDLAGVVGKVLGPWVFLSTLGKIGYIAPVLLVFGGLSLSFSSSEDKDEPEGDSTLPAKIFIGGLFIFVSACGLAHFYDNAERYGISGPYGLSDFNELKERGGILGFLVGAPLRAAFEQFGASLVLIAIGLIGLIVATGLTFREVGVKIWRSFQLSLRFVSKSVRVALGENREDIELSREGASQPQIQIDGESRVVGSPRGDESSENLQDTGGQPKIAQRGEESIPSADRLKEETGLRKQKIKKNDAAESVEQLEIELGPGAKGSPWKLPSPKILERSTSRDINEALVEERGRVLERALSTHGVETRLVGMVVGPTVTRYELELAPGVKVSKVTALNKDISYAMASADVRILAPIPGRQAIGVEVPNTERQVVALGDILAAPEARRATHPLEVAVGRDINGESVMVNLAEMPHVLIAGATGAGKSSCINSIVTSVLMRSTPETIRMILVDPKMVEMTQYEKVPHLLTQPVIDPKKAANALQWACREMDRRYELLAEVRFRDITGYNAAYDKGTIEAPPSAINADGSPKTYKRLPFILVVVDELSDLMMVAPRDVEDSICRIAQKARAVGIHLVIATQRPSTNVITGVIKANIPARIAFAVSSLTDSRVILDQGGAERLVGQGDMLLLDSKSSTPHRIQGAWVSEGEVRRVVEAWRKQKDPLKEDDNDESVSTEALITDVQVSAAGEEIPGGSTGDAEDDELLLKALELVVDSQLGSTSMLQRKLRVGFARAGRIMDMLEERGIVGPSEGSKPREVLVTQDQLSEPNGPNSQR